VLDPVVFSFDTLQLDIAQRVYFGQLHLRPHMVEDHTTARGFAFGDRDRWVLF